MQPNNNQGPSFFDPKTIFAIVAVAAIYFGWQTYISKKYPNYGQKVAVETAPLNPGEGTAPATPGSVESTTSGAVASTTKIVTTNEEKTLTFQSEKTNFVISSHGMGLKNLTVNTYNDKDKNRIQLGIFDQGSLFAARWTATQQPIDFDIKEETPGHFVGTAQIGEMGIRREMAYNPENGSFASKITFTKPTAELSSGVSIVLPESVHVAPSHSFLFPSYEHQDFIVIHEGGKSTATNFSAAKEDVHKDFKTASLVAVGSQYFATAVLDKSDLVPDVNVSSSVVGKTALAQVTYKPLQLLPEITFSQILYAGPKSIDILKSIDPEMPQIIDFGFFGFISRPLLYVMKACYSVVGNWGLAIIALTLLVRLCVLPFNIMSIKSMKAMQKVQPELKAMREKYKDDPVTLQKQTMVLMKEKGANPIGGCLPMLLQIPVFFALYRVIGSSIELYQSPFFGWITDLSSHDKFYVLPVLMGATMFAQQKLTPSQMDPAQAKIMAFLPLVFCVFMLQLPSGLTLYMFISTLFGVTQQYLFTRERKA